MKTLFLLTLSALLTFPAFAKEPGFYVNGVSASTAQGAKLLIEELNANSGDHSVCYESDYQAALENVHESISISVLDVYGESEFPSLDTEISGKDGSSAYGIIPSCGE